MLGHVLCGTHCPCLDAHQPDSHARSARVAQHGGFKAKTKETPEESRERRRRGGGLEEKELQLSSQTRTICLICVTCFLLI